MSRERHFWQRWAFNERFLIGAENPAGPMLERRRLIQTPVFGIYLHHIYREDLDRWPHDHPWPFVSFVLRGGYTEELRHDARVKVSDPVARRLFSLHHFPLKSAHRITSVQDGTVTLVLVGPHVREWGFYTPAGWLSQSDAFRSGVSLTPTQGSMG